MALQHWLLGISCRCWTVEPPWKLMLLSLQLAPEGGSCWCCSSKLNVWSHFCRSAEKMWISRLRPKKSQSCLWKTRWHCGMALVLAGSSMILRFAAYMKGSAWVHAMKVRICVAGQRPAFGYYHCQGQWWWQGEKPQIVLVRPGQLVVWRFAQLFMKEFNRRPKTSLLLQVKLVLQMPVLASLLKLLSFQIG